MKIIEELGISGSVHVLDPTLQLDAAFWHRYIRKPSEEHYVLVYQLNKHPWFNDFAESFARQKGLKLILLVLMSIRYLKANIAFLARTI